MIFRLVVGALVFCVPARVLVSTAMTASVGGLRSLTGSLLRVLKLGVRLGCRFSVGGGVRLDTHAVTLGYESGCIARPHGESFLCQE